MVVGVVTMQWAGLDDRGLDLRLVQEIFIFSKSPDRLWGQFNLLRIGYWRSFPGVRWLRRDVNQTSV